MVGPSNGKATASALTAEKNSTPDVRKAASDVNRIPGSAASMKVLERTRTSTSSPSQPASTSTNPPRSTGSNAPPTALATKTAIQAMQPFLETSTTSPIQPTDIQLLTTSILSNQERQRLILSHQELLIHSNVSLAELKKSLLFLSSSSWGQILEERHLGGKCSYPACGQSSGAGKGKARYRISLGRKVVKAVEEVDLGEAGNAWDDVRDFFCSKECYARSEWVLRWVLSDKELGLEESKGKGGGGGMLGGKWEKLTSGSDWKRIELLEDIEREAGVTFGQEGLLNGVRSEEVRVEDAATKTVDRVKGGGGKAANGVDNLLGDLTIVERPKVSSNPTTSSTTILATESRTPYTVDLPNTLGKRFTPSISSTHPTTATAAASETDDEDDQDVREQELSQILRYASLATGSRPPQRTRNPTIHFDPSPQTPTSDTKVTPGPDLSNTPPQQDPTLAAENAEIRRIMHLALDVRRDLREQGLLD